MRALPGQDTRVRLADRPAVVTRSTAAADQRRRILRAVGELVAERGYANVTVELIVKRAHVSYKTFYKHFAGKEECFIALFETTFATTEQVIRERLAAEPGEWSDQLVLALRTLIEQILADPVIARAVIVESPTAGPELTQRYERATKAFAPMLRAGRKLNPRGDELPETIEDALAGSVIWSAYEHLIVDRPEELASYLPVLVELILRTYLGPDEAARIARAQTVAREPAVA